MIHICNFVQARDGVKKKWVDGVDRRKGQRWRNRICAVVSRNTREIVVKLCKYLRAFTNLKMSGIRAGNSYCAMNILEIRGGLS